MALCAMMGTATLTSCEGTLDDVFGEWSRPTNTESNSKEKTPSTIEETPLTLEAVEAGTIKVIYQGDLKIAKPITYTKNGVSTSITGSTDITVAAGDIVSLSSENSTVNDDATGWLNILADHKIYVYGNVMSLINDEGDFSKDKTISEESALSGLFDSNANLYNHPEKKLLLPATTLAKSCYSGMFGNCTSLTTAPELPATTLADGCYGFIFFGCTSLTTAPELPATTLAEDCYAYMFYSCTGLKNAPELPATTLAAGCYSGMFLGCTSLTTAPELPATTLAEYCYSEMFWDCTGITTAPALPATTLAAHCYEYMFVNCTSLETAPVLPATTLADKCYMQMFTNCEKLSSVSCKATSGMNSTNLENWLEGAGTYATSPTLHVTTGYDKADWALPTVPTWTVAADL